MRKSLAADLPKVMADAEAIKRALANLVDNAAEAMQDSLVREIEISTSLVASRDAVEITVADTGHGVTRELKKVFSFLIFPLKTWHRPGTCDCESDCRGHHGSIRVEENQPVGARFIVELPVVPKPLLSTSALSMHKILIVDDEPTIRDRCKAFWRMKVMKRGQSTAVKHALELLRASTLRSGAARCLAARHGWPGDAGENSRYGKRTRSHHDFGTRHH